MIHIQVNAGVLDFKSLNTIPGQDLFDMTSPVDGSKLHAVINYHPQYPGMIPLVCLTVTPGDPDEDGFEICMMLFGETVVFPVFHHFGLSPKHPEPCDWYVFVSLF